MRLSLSSCHFLNPIAICINDVVGKSFTMIPTNGYVTPTPTITTFNEKEIFMDYVNAFWVGGLICALVQILLDKTKLMPGRIMVLLVCSGAFLSAIGIYQPLVDFAGAGASVPLLGFGHTLWKGMKKSIEEDGFLGLFSGGFTACAVGVSAALIFSYIASWIAKPKMKD